MRSDPDPVFDAVIVGGGPAGLATALALHRRGLRAMVVDRRRPPIDEPCGEGLMPDGVECLANLGVDVDAVPHRPFRGIRYLDAEGTLAAEAAFPGTPGRGIRRTQLHRALVDAAEQAGIDLRWNTRALGLATGDGCGHVLRVQSQGEGDGSEEIVRARWLIGADGLRSKVRHWLGLARPSGESSDAERFGVRRHVRLAPWTDRVEVYWADGCEAYVTPVADDQVGVAILVRRGATPSVRFDPLIERFPFLARRLRDAPVASRDRGIGPLRQRVRDVVQADTNGHRAALVGDASGYVDAITGEGLSLAFHQALALADAVADDDPSAYRRRHRAIDRVPRGLTELLLFVEAHPALRRRMLCALRRDPDLFTRFLAVHARAAPPHRLLAVAPRLLWRLLTAPGAVTVATAETPGTG